MKSATNHTVSRFTVWLTVFGILCAFLLPVTSAIGGITSASKPAIQTLGSFLCPNDSTAQSYSYSTTIVDDYGTPQQSTAHVLQCVDASGKIVKEDHLAYGFVWMGIMALIGLVLAAILATILTFVFTAPTRAWAEKLLDGTKS